MAGRTPMINEQSVSTRPAAPGYLQANPTPAAYGAGAGQGLQALGSDLGQIAAREKMKANAFAAADLEEQLSEKVRPILLDKDTGFFNQQGAAALDSKPTIESIKKEMDKLAASAPNEEVRRVFLDRARSRSDSWFDQIERHSGGQRQAYYKDRTNGQIGLALDQIEADHASPEKVGKVIEKTLPLLVVQWSDNEHLPISEVQRLMRRFQVAAVDKALASFGDDAAGGMSFLNGELPGGRKVRDVVGAEIAEKYEKGFKAVAEVHAAAALGEELFQRYGGNATKANAELKRLFDLSQRKPIIENADGTFSTERTTTWTINGKEVVMPTIIDGKEYTAEQAKDIWLNDKTELGDTLRADSKSFATREEADKYAIDRHNNEQRTRESDRGATVYSPDVLGAARNHYMEAVRQGESARQMQEAATYDRAYTLFEQYGHNTTVLEARHPSLWNNELSGQDRDRIRAVEASFARNEPNSQENGAWAKVIELASANPAMFDAVKAEDLKDKYLPLVGKHHWPALLAKYNELRTRNMADDPMRKVLEQAFQARVKASLGIVYDPANPGASQIASLPDDKQLAYLWASAQWANYLKTYASDKNRVNKVPTWDEAMVIVNGLTKKVVTDNGYLWNTTAPVSLAVAQNTPVPYSDIPGDHRAAIEKVKAGQLGRKPTKAEVEKAYLEWLRKSLPSGGEPGMPESLKR